MQDSRDLIAEIDSIMDERSVLTEKLRVGSVSNTHEEVIDLKNQIQDIDNIVDSIQSILDKRG